MTDVGAEDVPVEDALASLKECLSTGFEIRDLIARNPVAHKWKATYRSLLLREAVYWRFEDLLQQSYTLHKQGHALGALILLRSALETLAVLIYLNQITASVLEGALNFHEFSNKTARLLLGSKNKSTEHNAVHINDVLKKCAKPYDFIEQFYADLSECAHPNHEGLIMGYSRPDTENFIEHFANHWSALYSATHEHKMTTVMMMFQHEYNVVWKENFERLEAWLVENNAELERTKKTKQNEGAR